jgi:hypothetical protein
MFSYLVVIYISTWISLLATSTVKDCEMDPDIYSRYSIYHHTSQWIPLYETTISYCKYAHQLQIKHSSYEEIENIRGKPIKMYEINKCIIVLYLKIFIKLNLF